ncbi:hypothetical protein IQ07DRAFT_589611 [Pyrenochaeta sp. DS3sAY3a]|nr:hypothetical protein IQ07DRAFT_589611 [Pyrenochaeta sp. DS3sAY3a]
MADTRSSIATSSSDLLFAEDSPNFEIPIYPAGDGAELHFKNDPNDPDQRDTLAQRKGRVKIGCEHKDIVHGFFSDEVDDLYTLIVVKFRFDPNGIAARIKEAHAVLKFAGTEIGKPDPEVVTMYPDDSYFVEPTKQHEQVVRGAEAIAGAGAAGAQGSATLKLEKTIDRELTDYARVIGSSEATRGFGKKNAIAWDFFENPTAKTGIVTSLQGAVLLKRKNMERFKATLSLEVVADTFSRVTSVFKKDEKDDDIFYNPSRAPTNNMRTYDVENLGKWKSELKSLSDVTFRTVLKDSVKEL